jgi:hypothetical protein
MTLLQGLAWAAAGGVVLLVGVAGFVYWAFSDYPVMDENC